MLSCRWHGFIWCRTSCTTPVPKSQTHPTTANSEIYLLIHVLLHVSFALQCNLNSLNIYIYFLCTALSRSCHRSLVTWARRTGTSRPGCRPSSSRSGKNHVTSFEPFCLLAITIPHAFFKNIFSAKDHDLLSCLGGLGHIPRIISDPAAKHLFGAHQTGRGAA